ncbi:hypothetical protein E4U24_007375 [Claviceps purpurea]|nr:hypothetical protein E4U25_004666 [Claviceps purpurea]KAG6254691.1 hypothetical protein E4U24_007375 [Claviceps purpurea]
MHDKDSQAAASICPRLANLLLSRCQGALVAKLSADDIWGMYSVYLGDIWRTEAPVTGHPCMPGWERSLYHLWRIDEAQWGREAAQWRNCVNVVMAGGLGGAI